MNLKDCKLDIGTIISAPMVRSEPEPDWIIARKSLIIPTTAFSLYRRSNYCSLGSAPSFLADEKKYLFSYFSMILRSIKDSLIDADQELQIFISDQAQVYDPGKKFRGESWDPQADGRARKHFRLLLLSLQSGLDAVADLVGMFFTGVIPGLRVGRAKFSLIESWLDKLQPVAGLLVTPQQHKAGELHRQLKSIVRVQGCEKDWLPLMRMLRNKGAHLGDSVFRYVCLHNDKGQFYTFLPRQWPFIWEEHIKPTGAKTKDESPPIATLLQAALVHQDIVSYAQGIRAKVTELISVTLGVLDSAYHEFKDFPLNEAALAELQGSFESFSFEKFSE